ncbi:MAG: hypothetical protein GY940_34520 [bacterium]|nr:hypothetical protein [bacterium]
MKVVDPGRPRITQKSLIYLESRRAIRDNWILTAAVLLCAFLLYMVQMGIWETHEEIKEVKTASNLEAVKHKQFDRYTPYSVYGVRFHCMPTTLNFLLTFQLYDSLGSAVDSGTKLIIYESRKGNQVTPSTSGGYLNYSGIFLLSVSLLGLYFGFNSYKNKKYLKYLCSLKSFNNVFFSILFTRMALFSLYTLFVLFGTAVLTLFNGIDIFNFHFASFALVALLVSNLFLFTGTAAGSLENRKTGITMMILILVLLDIVAPWVVIKTVKNISVSISEQPTELDKLKNLMTFEKRGIKQFKDVRSGKKIKKFVKGYLEKELKEQERMETQHMNRIIEKIDKYRGLSVFFPTIFYFNTATEISGKGFESFTNFYKFTQKMKRKFIEFFFDKRYINPSEPKGKVEPFIKGDESIFPLRSHLPRYFIAGIVILLLYCTGFVIFSYITLRKNIYPVKRHFPEESSLFIHLLEGVPIFFFTAAPLLKSKLYNHFSGRETLSSEIDFLPHAPFDASGPIDFAYLPEATALSRISAQTLNIFLNGVKPKTNCHISEVMFAHALRRDLLVFDGFLEGFPPTVIEEFLHQLKDKNKFHLIITADYYMTRALALKKSDIYYLKTDSTAQPIADDDMISTPDDKPQPKN